MFQGAAGLVSAPNPVAGFVVGAVYRRREDIHARLGGQWQSGISTPRDSPYVILFTSRAGLQHGYHDRYGDDGRFFYYGHGQVGDMQMEGGNKAIRDHVRNGKRLLVFLALGDGGHRFVGEFAYEGHYVEPGVPDRNGDTRNAIVFLLRPMHDEIGEEYRLPPPPVDDELLEQTERYVIAAARTKQGLFRRRLATLEKGCRLTGVTDLRFLRASHIKPWADSTDTERVDRHNGLLLTPSADLLFDHGWLSFQDDGRLITAGQLPEEIHDKLGLDLRGGRRCGSFTAEQTAFLGYHRDCILGQRDYQNRLIGELSD